MKRFLFIILAVSFLHMPSYAQSNSSNIKSVRRGIATVMFASLAGAVLGLSTLSFYGEPQEHISNIWLGMGIGAIAGGILVINQNSKSYSEMNWPSNPHQLKARGPLLYAYQWQF